MDLDWKKIAALVMPVVVALGSGYGLGSDRTAAADQAQAEVISIVRQTIGDEIGRVIQASVAKEVAPLRTSLSLLSTRIAWAETRVSDLEAMPADVTPAAAIREWAELTPTDPGAACPAPYWREPDGWCRPCRGQTHWTARGCAPNPTPSR
jgi:hypothetical protein